LIAFGLFTYLFSVGVFSNYFQYVPGMVADRFLLVPSLGWCIVLVGVLRRLSGLSETVRNFEWANIKPAAKYPFLAILLLYSALTFSRNLNWKDDLTLFRHDIKYVPQSAQAHNLLALHLMMRTSTEQNASIKSELTNEALLHFKQALKIYPYFFNINYDVGRVYTILNNSDSAIHYFERAVAIDTLLPDIYLKLGDMYSAKGNFEKSNFHLKKYIASTPSEYAGYSKLSYNYFLMKEYDASIALNKRAISLMPNLTDPYINIAHVFVETNRRDSAVFYLLEAKKVDPNNAAVLDRLKQMGVQ
jgi:tetratricopeptide (TPR) repeat protein